MLLLVFHLVAFLHFFFAIYYDLRYVTLPLDKFPDARRYGGKMKYLTFWDELLQMSYFGVCLLNDVLGSSDPLSTKKPPLQKVRDFMCTTMAFPSAALVSVVFWTLYAIDRELIFPKLLDAHFPMWLNHMVHTNIAIFIILDMFLACHCYPTFKKGALGLVGFLGTYLGWTFYMAFDGDLWVYPILQVLNWGYRTAFIVTSLAIALIFYKVGENLNLLLWGKTLSKVGSVGSSKNRLNKNKRKSK